MITVGVIAIVLLAMLGLPLFLVIGGASVLGYLSGGQNLELFFASYYLGVSSTPIYIAIPLFTLAGYLMAESGAPNRLVRFSRAAVGWLPGGLAMVALVACAGFTAFTGASGVTIVALGGLLLPALLKDGYPERFTLGLLTSGGSRGILFPPSLPLIVYAMIAGLTMQSIPADLGASGPAEDPAAVEAPAPKQEKDAAQAALDEEMDRLLAEDDAAADEGEAAAVEDEAAAAATPEAGAGEGEATVAAGEDDPAAGPAAAAPTADDADEDEGDEVLAELGIDDPAAEIAAIEAQAKDAAAAQAGSDVDGTPPEATAPPAPRGEVMQVTVDRLFVAGAIPGLLALGMVALYALYFGIRHKVPRSKFSIRELLVATREMAWEIPIPLIVVVGIYGGFFTAIDGAALVAAYTLIVEVFIYRDIPIRKLPTIFREAMVLVGGILLILMSATALTNFFIDREVPQKLFELVRANISSPLTFLIVLNLFLLAVGMLMDIYSAIMVVVPIIIPVALHYGINPVHLGIVFLTNMEIGFNTPPVGVNLFVGSLAFRKPVIDLIRAILPFLLISIVALVLITYWPDLSLFLVNALGVE
ncbi:MAG TPA: TRAP transporter large permease [Myxococcota bacterium]|nr:TRAP transporter large permease [Myxococcota bacterium]